MTTEEFNELPADVRQFIKNHVSCLGCGNASVKMDKAFELYKRSILQSAFIIFGGGINYNVDGKKDVLTSLKDTDNDFVKLQKLSLARQFHESHPHIFKAYNTDLVDKLIEELYSSETLEINDIVSLENSLGKSNEKKDSSDLEGVKQFALNPIQGVKEPVKEVDTILEGNQNSTPLFDLENASYDQMKAFVKANDIEVASQSKADYIAAITLFLAQNK